jgi:hypothetical protein
MDEDIMKENAANDLKRYSLWAAAFGCYVYGDLLSHWVPGAQDRMDAGTMGPLGTVSPGLLLGIGAFMSVPALMIALSTILPPIWSRWANVVLGAIYSLLVASSLPTAPPFYLHLSYMAWKWPRAGLAE